MGLLLLTKNQFPKTIHWLGFLLSVFNSALCIHGFRVHSRMFEVIGNHFTCSPFTLFSHSLSRAGNSSTCVCVCWRVCYLFATLASGAVTNIYFYSLTFGKYPKSIFPANRTPWMAMVVVVHLVLQILFGTKDRFSHNRAGCFINVSIKQSRLMI